MRKLTLLLALATILSCSKEEINIVQEEECECVRRTWVKVRSNNGIIRDWYWNGAESYFSDDCDDDGTFPPGSYSGSTNGVTTYIQYRVTCN